MQFFILVLLICLFVFLYCVYLLAHDDFIFLRRDVTMERIFNTVFLGSLFSLFFARLFYGIFDASNIFSNPFVFVLFPYFPGLSLLGAVLGAGIFIIFVSRRKNTLPLKRLSDFFSIAFLVTLPIGFLGYFMLSEGGLSFAKAGSLILSYLVLFIISLTFLLPKLLSGKFKEGTIAFLFLICFCLISLIANAFPQINVLDYFKSLENIALMLLLLSSVGLIVRQENLLFKIKEFRKKK